MSQTPEVFFCQSFHQENHMDTIETENQLGITFCDRLPLAFTHGKGSRVWDETGKEYLDFTSGWGVTCLGHSHAVIVAAIANQASRLMQSPNAGFTYSPERAALLRLLQPLLPGELSHLYFCNSGAEANDAVLKLARKVTGKRKIISTNGSFHGRSFNTLSVSRGPENSARYLPVLADIGWVPFGDLDTLQAALDDETAAVIVEPVQGEGGVQIPDPGWLAGVQAVCRKHGALLIIDEVQTGFCRTGALFAVNHSPVPIFPDLMTMAKGIAGGFPFAAFAVTDKVNGRISKDDHGGTYCGNPLACAVSYAVIQYLVEHQVDRQVALKGMLLLSALQQLHTSYPELIKSVRGTGLLCALEFSIPSLAGQFTRACAESGLLVVPTRNGIVRLIPDLLVSRSDLSEAVKILEYTCAGLHA